MENLKKMSIKFYLMLVAMASVVFTGCENLEDDAVTPEFPALKEQTVVLEETTDENGESVFSASLDITFSANLDWNIESDAAWCKFVNGEFTESTSTGIAGEQTLKVLISSEGWNYTSDDVAQITLKMGEKEEVIYKIIRAKNVFTDMTVTDSEGNSYNRENPIVIKGGTPSNPVYVDITVTSDFPIGILADELPDWILLEAGDENGEYSFAFNENSENESIKYSIGAERGFNISFAVDIDGEIIPAYIPVVYEGMDPQYASFTETYTTMHYVRKNGKKISTVDMGMGGEINTYENKLETTVISRNDDYEVVKFVQHGDYQNWAGMEPVFLPTGDYELDNGENLQWLSVTKDADKLTFTFAENATNEIRSAAVYVLPRELYNEVQNDLMQVVDWETGARFETYLVLSVYQSNVDPVVSFKSYIDMHDGSGLQSLKDMTGELASLDPNSETNSYIAGLDPLGYEIFGFGDVYLEVYEYSSDMTVEVSNSSSLVVTDIDGKKYVKINSSIADGDKITVKKGDTIVAECVFDIPTE